MYIFNGSIFFISDSISEKVGLDVQLYSTGYNGEFKEMLNDDSKTLKDYEKAEKLTGVSYNLTTRLKHQIQSVDGKTDRKSINEFVDNEFLSVDSLAFRNYVAETSPNLDFRIEVENSRGEKEKVVVPMTAQFFWPDSRL